MLDVEERFTIRDIHRRGLSISEIARRTGHDRKTIRNVVRGSLEAEPKARQHKRR